MRDLCANGAESAAAALIADASGLSSVQRAEITACRLPLASASVFVAGEPSAALSSLLHALASNAPAPSSTKFPQPQRATLDAVTLLVAWSLPKCADTRARCELLASLFRVWSVRGRPSESIIDSLGVRPLTLALNSITNGAPTPKAPLSRITELARQERALGSGGGGGGGAAAVTEYVAVRAFLWQARRGTWLRGAGLLPPRTAFATVSAAELRACVARDDMDADELTSWSAAFAEAMAAESAVQPAPPLSLQEPHITLLAPRDFHPLVDLPPGAGPAVRAIAALLREATGVLIHPNGIAAPPLLPNTTPALDANLLLTAIDAVESGADVRAILSIAEWYAIPRVSPLLVSAVRKLCRAGHPAEAAQAIAAAQHEENAATAPAAVRAVPDAQRDFVPWRVANVRPAAKATINTIEAAADAAPFALRPAFRAMQAAVVARCTAGGPATALAVAPAAVAPSNLISEAYSAAVAACSGAGAHVQALMAWAALVESGAQPTGAAVSAALASAAHLRLPHDVYRLVGWVEAQRGFIQRDASASTTTWGAALAAAHDPTAFTLSLRAKMPPLAVAIRGLSDVFSDISAGSFSPRLEEKKPLHRLPQDDRAAASARGDPASDAALLGGRGFFGTATLIFPMQLEGGGESAGAAGRAPAALLRAVPPEAMVGAMSALAALGDGAYLGLVFLRELGRIAALRAGNDQGARLDDSVAAAAVAGLAACGELDAAVEAMRAALVFGASLPLSIFLEVPANACASTELEPAFQALRIAAASGVMRVDGGIAGERDEALVQRTLMRMVMRMARAAVPVPTHLSDAITRHMCDERKRIDALRGDAYMVVDPFSLGTSSPTMLSIDARTISPISDPVLARAVRRVLRGGTALLEESRPLSASANDASLVVVAIAAKPVAAEAPVAGAAAAIAVPTMALEMTATLPQHPLALAAVTAELVSTALVRWAVQQMQTATPNAVAVGSTTPLPLVEQEKGTGTGAGAGAARVVAAWEDAEDERDPLVAAREMVALVLDAWPVSVALAEAAHPSTDVSVARTRADMARARIEKKIAAAMERAAAAKDTSSASSVVAPLPADRRPLADTLPALLARALSYEEFLGLAAACTISHHTRASSSVSSSSRVAALAAAAAHHPALASAFGPQAFTAALLPQAAEAVRRTRAPRLSKSIVMPVRELTDAEHSAEWAALRDAIKFGAATHGAAAGRGASPRGAASVSPDLEMLYRGSANRARE